MTIVHTMPGQRRRWVGFRHWVGRQTTSSPLPRAPRRGCVVAIRARWGSAGQPYPATRRSPAASAAGPVYPSSGRVMAGHQTDQPKNAWATAHDWAAPSSACGRLGERQRQRSRRRAAPPCGRTARSDEVGGQQAVARREDAVVGRRRAAALDVPERVTRVSKPVRSSISRRERSPTPPSRTCPNSSPSSASRRRRLGQLSPRPRPRWRSPCRARGGAGSRRTHRSTTSGARGSGSMSAPPAMPGDGDPAGVAAHHLDDHHAVVRLGGRVQAVDRLGRDRTAVSKPKV